MLSNSSNSRQPCANPFRNQIRNAHVCWSQGGGGGYIPHESLLRAPGSRKNAALALRLSLKRTSRRLSLGVCSLLTKRFSLKVLAKRTSLNVFR